MKGFRLFKILAKNHIVPLDLELGAYLLDCYWFFYLIMKEKMNRGEEVCYSEEELLCYRSDGYLCINLQGQDILLVDFLKFTLFHRVSTLWVQNFL